MLKKIVITLVSLVVVGGAFLVFAGSRAAYESPEYKIVKKEGAFEVRRYPEMTLASTTTTGSPTPGADGSFMRLFRYIAKGNKADQKISMTTPVLTTPAVGDQSKALNFVLPKEVAAGNVPLPKSDRVQIRTFRGGIFATYRFSGSWDEDQNLEAIQKLESWLKRQPFAPEGAPITANYDHPATPPSLRRNEILIRVSSLAGQADVGEER